MNIPNQKKKWAALLTLALMTPAIWAQSMMSNDVPPPAPPADLSRMSNSSVSMEIGELPPEKHQGDVTYVSGGVPDEQLPAIKQMRGQYPLVIELYQKAGAKSEFTSGAEVKLIDQAGKLVLEAKSEGPFMLVKLRPGTYQVQASLNGKTVKAKSVKVAPKGSRKAVIIFPAGTD